MATAPAADFDYVVVGSGAGGGPVAANLATAGFHVLLVEAGDDYSDVNYDVPAFHARATQDPAMRWDFYVQHYSAEERNTKRYDPKYVDGKGVLYPRAGTLGGCTAHHALITVYPHNSDWEGLSQIARTYDPADRSWEPDRMRRLFERIERCNYLPKPAAGDGPARHGFGGWLATDVITDLLDPATLLANPDLELFQVVLGAVHATLWDVDLDLEDPSAFGRLLDRIEGALAEAPKLREIFSLRGLLDDKAALKAHIRGVVNAFFDPNQYQVTLDRREGVFLVPISVSGDLRKRVGARDRILQAKARAPGNLTIWCNTFVTRVVFEGKRAVGIEYVQGPRYYDAAWEPAGGRHRSEKREQVRVRREVIVCGGAFNTPQLLMLSGVGPKDHLAEHGIQGEALVSDLPAVGRFLQDRYEVGLISEVPRNFTTLMNALFRMPRPGEHDPTFDRWKDHHDGLYATNGAVLSIIRKSSPSAAAPPDLFIFGLPASFHGYFPGYDEVLEAQQNRFTWAILKAHTKNQGGSVRLATGNPYDRPKINFAYFDEGTDKGGDDLNAVVEGISFVRRFMTHLGVEARPLVAKDGAPVDLNDRRQVTEWVMREAWGHHACGTCRIGPRDAPDKAALDPNFKVRGVYGLRVVDASVFPEIPGFFIVTPIYMIAEKASESILRDAGWTQPGAGPEDLNLPDIV
jgi:choline dehydrogenase